MKRGILFLFAALYGWTTFGAAEIVPIAEKAMGQSLAGADLNNDSLYSNPAGSAFSELYSIEGSYYGSGAFSASILDTQTSSLGGGIGYYRFPVKGTDNLNQGMKISVLGRITESLGWGVAGKLLWGTDESNQKQNLKDLDVGVIYSVPTVQFGGFFRNILGGRPGYLNQDREVVVGGRINYEQTLFLSVAANTKLEGFNPYQIGVGAEYLSPYNFLLRVGFRALLDESLSFWSAGVGVDSGRMGIHYALEIPNQGSAPLEHMLSINLML